MYATARFALLVLAAGAALAAFAGAARAQTLLPASYYGGGLEAGAVVTASIGDAECGSDTVGADGGWAISVAAGGCGGAAVAGATVAFAIDGALAEQTAAWKAGGRPDDIGLGIALTPAPPKPSATFGGGGIDAGVVVAASIGGAACGEAEAGADGRWTIAVREGDCDGGAESGAVVSFTLDGSEATPTATWEPGGEDDDIALTASRRPSATFGGGGIDAGVVVAASIGGAACGEAEAGADGRWTIVVREGDCEGRAASGAVVSFTLDGSEARPAAAWEPGGEDDDIALTANWVTLDLDGARAAYVASVDGGIASYIVGAPDFVNAPFVGRWVVESEQPALTLGIEGARALYVLGADGAVAVHVVGAPDFVNAPFARLWVVSASP